MTDIENTTTESTEGTLPSFNEMPLSQDVKDALADMGYEHPAPVQHAVYEAAVRGKDLVVQARTGTGKTAAFGIPLIDQIVKRHQPEVQALVLTPTRELAVQVTKELQRIAAKRNVKVAAVYGGAPMQRQIDAIADGAQIVVGTPGRVLDHLRRGTLVADSVRAFVLDESDEMLSMGFERDMRAIEAFLPDPHQTLLFSATLPPDILRMVSERLHDPQFIYLSGDHVGALEILHYVYFVSTDKIGTLLRILEVEDPESALIFCNTRDQTEAVANALVKAGYDADWLNGDLSQNERERVMARSKEGRLRFLVATDVAARGIDISHLTHVINFDFPESAETYVHRTGRTGRMGRTGTAISLVTPQDIGALYYLRLTYKIRPFEKRLPSEGELKTRMETDIINMLVEGLLRQEPHPDDVSLARRLLTHERAEHLVAALLRNHLGDREESEEQAGAARRSRRPQPAPRRSRKERREAGTRNKEHKENNGAAQKAERKRQRTRNKEQRAPEPASNRREATSPPRPVQEAPDKEAPRAEVREASVSEVAPPDSEQHVEFEPELPAFHEEPLTEEAIAMAREEAARREKLRQSSAEEVPTPKENDQPESKPPAAETDSEPNRVESDGSTPSPKTEKRDDNDQQKPALDATDQPETQQPSPQEPTIEVFVNVGRRDGVRPGDFIRLLTAVEGIEKEDIGRIRIRDRNSFIAVRGAVLGQAVNALEGKQIGDRIAKAGVARPRSPDDAPDE